MKTFAIITSLLAGSLTVLADTASVRAQIAIIQATTQQLSNDVQLYNGGVVGLPYALQVQQDAIQSYKGLKAANAAVLASSNFGEPGSAQIAKDLLSTSSVVIKALDNVKAKASAFGDLQPLVLASLYSLKRNTDIFADNLAGKLAIIEKSTAPLVKGQLDSSFNSAIVAYGGTAQ